VRRACSLSAARAGTGPGGAEGPAAADELNATAPVSEFAYHFLDFYLVMMIVRCL
jgi:hypothetical protein